MAISKLHINILLSLLLLTLPTFSLEANSNANFFNKGVNLSDWFLAEKAVDIKKEKYNYSEFYRLGKFGINVVRLPIRMTSMTSESPNYTIDPVLLDKLDWALDLAENAGIHIIIDNHGFPLTNENTKLFKIWKQIATHCKDRSALIYYELMNEPGGEFLKANWGTIQGALIDSIRAIDKTHTIVVTATVTDGKIDFDKLPVYTDNNLIYTFHFYKPFLFTHQGAWWTQIKNVSGIPFPYNSSTMPECPAELIGTGEWGDQLFYNYPTEGTVDKMMQYIDEVVNFSKTRNVKIWCGEFGVYMNAVKNDERVKWYKLTTDYLNLRNIPWTMWDYRNTFGLFVKGTVNYNFDKELNVPLLEAIGFNVPAIYNPGPLPTIPIYTDTPGAYISTYFWPNEGGTIAENNIDSFEGSKSIEWKVGSKPYGDLVFNLWNRFTESPFDLSQYYTNQASLEFSFKSSTIIDPAKINMTCKLINYNSQGIPYESVFDLTSTQLTFDGNWHEVIIPLSTFKNKGTYHNGTFYPEGNFKWTNINKLKISTRNIDLAGSLLYFDDFKINFNHVTTTTSDLSLKNNHFFITPTLINTNAVIETGEKPGVLQVLDSMGKIVHDFGMIHPNTKLQWNSSHLPNGIYLCRFASITCETKKIIIRK